MTTGWQWTSTSAVSNMPYFTSSTPASGPKSCATWASSNLTNPSNASSLRACSRLNASTVSSLTEENAGSIRANSISSMTPKAELKRSLPRKTVCPSSPAVSKRCLSRKNNVVEPSAIIGKFGADTARAFVMFAGPPDQQQPGAIPEPKVRSAS